MILIVQDEETKVSMILIFQDEDTKVSKIVLEAAPEGDRSVTFFQNFVFEKTGEKF